MAYMKFEFILQVNSDDAKHEEERSEALVERILGRNNVITYRYVETLSSEEVSNAKSTETL